MRRPFRAGGGAAVDWLIVGLGKPGREHEGTRHNLGFLVAEELVSRWGLRFGRDRFRARLAEGRVLADGAPDIGAARAGAAPRVAVMLPQTYMNDSGRSVGPARGSLKVPLDHVVVVYDEIDLPFGEVRSRLGGGTAGHNGMKSLQRELGGGDFLRVRAGVGRPDSTDPEIVSAWVLGRFREPREEVAGLVARAADEVQRIVASPDGEQLGGRAPESAR